MAENGVAVDGGSLELAREIHRLMEENKALRRVIEDADVKRDAWLEKGGPGRSINGSLSKLVVRVNPVDAFDDKHMVRHLSVEVAEKMWEWLSKHGTPGLAGSHYNRSPMSNELEWRLYVVEVMP